jgi:hypothetical protein
MIKQLVYDFEDGTRIEFTKYVIDGGIIKNKKTGKILKYRKLDKYNVCTVRDDCGKPRCIRVGRAMASTFLCSPPTLEHTVDHKNNNRDEDTVDNIRWLDKSGQSKNQDRPETYQSSFIIVKGDIEKTAKEWVDHLKAEKNHMGNEYNTYMFRHYAQKKQHGFSYKEYPDFIGEVWKKIIDSENAQGRWEISNMNRIKYITKHAENVLTTKRLGLNNGYPTITINGKQWFCHILSFMTFFPEQYNNKEPGELILHEDDDKLDFRPHKLRVGNGSDNSRDAYNNGKRDNMITSRMSCASYINGVLEREYVSQTDAEIYLKSLGYEKAKQGHISNMLNPKTKRKTAYGRTWKICEIAN